MNILEFSDDDAILTFDGEFDFLSNFYPSVVSFEGFIFHTVEHAYQAAKNPSTPNLRRFATEIIGPGAAKRVGRTIDKRADWHDVKVQVMADLLEQKFKDPNLQRRLMKTGNRVIEEGNDWGDTFWGVCPPGSGNGKNHLGRLLMQVREQLLQ